MLSPKKIPHRKVQRGSLKGSASGGTVVSFGDYGIQALQRHWITNRQIESARVAMTRHMKRGGKVWINIFPDKPVTKKPAETRMGKGKGNPEIWVAPVKPGRVMFEIADVESEVAREALRLAIQKLPIKCKIVLREGFDEFAKKEIAEKDTIKIMTTEEREAEEAAHIAASGIAPVAETEEAVEAEADKKADGDTKSADKADNSAEDAKDEQAKDDKSEENADKGEAE